jgi:hypothetical protein
MGEIQYHHLVEESRGLMAIKVKPYILNKFMIVHVTGPRGLVVYRPDPTGKSLKGGSLETIFGEPAHTPEEAIEQWKAQIRHQIERRRVEIRDLEAQLLNPQIEIPPGLDGNG